MSDSPDADSNSDFVAARYLKRCIQVEFAADSPLEETGFEPPVPLATESLPLAGSGMPHEAKRAINLLRRCWLKKSGVAARRAQYYTLALTKKDLIYTV